MEGYEQELHINDELFAGMRADADRVLQKLIKNMVEKDSLEGRVSIGIDVSFTQEYIMNRDPKIEGETRRVLTPKFSHKIGSVMQIKEDAKGDRNCDGTELVWDEEKGEYVLRPIANTDQMSIFDADFRCVNDPEEDDEEELDTESPALEGRRVASLPGPTDEADSDSTETDEQEDMSQEFSERDELPFGEDADDDDGYSYEEPDEY